MNLSLLVFITGVSVYAFEGYLEFSKKVSIIKNDILFLIQSLRTEHIVIGGYGAPAKGNTLLNFLELTPWVNYLYRNLEAPL